MRNPVILLALAVVLVLAACAPATPAFDYEADGAVETGAEETKTPSSLPPVAPVGVYSLTDYESVAASLYHFVGILTADPDGDGTYEAYVVDMKRVSQKYGTGRGEVEVSPSGYVTIYWP